MVIIKKAALYWFTLKYLKPVQVLSRLWQKISIAKKRPVPEPVTCRLVCVQQADFIAKPNSILSSNQFVFLNQEKATQTAIDWNDKDIPKLWLYNLHYHDGLGCLVTLVDTKRTFINRWIKENPVGSGNGWEPYPLSLRIVNWVKWLLDGDKPVEGMITSLVSQTHSLGQQLEYHLLGNHLFANAKALVFVGCFFDGPQAEKWLQKGLKILYKEIPEQFLEDGAHFELSTTYQATLTEDLLDIINILQAYGQKVSKKWKETACSAVRWQKNMTRPDGLPPLFNDAAYGISPSLTDIDSYAKRLDLKVETLELEALIDLQPSGYFRYEGDNYSFFGDAGQIGPDYIPGHAHCDMLNFELFANGQPMIVDTGISTYEVCEQRHYERSTAAHNTVQLGDVEQSEIWSAFRVARRAKIIERSAQELSLIHI